MADAQNFFRKNSFCSRKVKKLIIQRFLITQNFLFIKFVFLSILCLLVVWLNLNCSTINLKNKKKVAKFVSQKNPKKLDSQKNQHLQFHHQNCSRNVDEDDDNDGGGETREFSPHYDDNSYQTHNFYLEQESGHQFRELYSQFGTQNYEPISENLKKRACLGSSSECTPGVRRNAAMKNPGEIDGGGTGEVSARTALRRAGMGEIVEVQGGHIVRATGRKDRHSKVCTAKGPRDRRVRLAAHTAIQFYDVQDRLGYDRPSKAVDWLIKKAKASIDELEQLPAWSPSSMSMLSTSRRKGKGSGEAKTTELGEDGGVGGEQQQLYGNADGSGVSLLPPSLDSDAIADTIKSFFPMGGGVSAASTRPQMQFQDYNHGGGGGSGGGADGGSRQSQDLRLSLQSFQVQDPIMMHSHNEHQNAVFGGAGAAQVGYENPNVGWAESQHQPSPELGRLHRLVTGWQNQHHNSSIDQHHHSGSGGVGVGTVVSGGGDAGGGFMFNQPSLLQPLFGGQQSQYFTQRGPLQSSNIPSIRAWISDPSIATTNEHLQAIPVHPQGYSGLGFSSGGFSGYHFPTRIQGEEEHSGDLKPSSASSGSHH